MCVLAITFPVGRTDLDGFLFGQLDSGFKSLQLYIHQSKRDGHREFQIIAYDTFSPRVKKIVRERAHTRKRYNLSVASLLLGRDTNIYPYF